MIKFIVEYLITRIKKRKFEFDKLISSVYILHLSLKNTFCLFRGLVRLHKTISLGCNVSIYCKNNMIVGSGVSIGDYCNIDALGHTGIIIQTGSSIGRFSSLKVSGSLTNLGKHIKIGKNVGIGEFSHIGGAGGVEIGDDTICGPYLSIHPENHNFKDENILIRNQGVTRKGIVVGNNCWIGAKVTILDGCKIGSNSVIAAGAVVKGEFPANSIIVGVPARCIEIRK